MLNAALFIRRGHHDRNRTVICNNGLDDDNNGSIDCFDSNCSNLSEAISIGKFVEKYSIIGTASFFYTS